MTVAVDDIINSVATTLLDTAHRGWSRAELVGYINEALAATAGAKPDFYTVEQDISMVAGITQALPEGGLSLFNVSKNVTSSRVVTQVDGALLDEANRWWPAATQEVDVEHFTADPRDPRRFSITPPNDGTGAVTATFGAVPDAVTGSSGEEIPVAGSYLSPLVEYVLGKCYGKNSKSQDLTKSNTHMQRWGTLVGLKAKAQIAVAPKVAVSEGNA